ncbi:hypothetical protein [Lysobacter gummosus]|uniref:hypothetical protein n=1 Tax=Lysobacter gummosus TaxID=262324 RepID=UPI0036434D17
MVLRRQNSNNLQCVSDFLEVVAFAHGPFAAREFLVEAGRDLRRFGGEQFRENAQA